MSVTYSTIDKAIDALIAIEKAEEGYLEKASNKNLDSKTANAGYNNYTKYWRDLNELGLMKQGSNFAGGSAWYWCAGFQHWSFIMAFGAAGAKTLLLHAPYISCATLGEKGAKQIDGTPKKGDIVLFHNGTRFYHTGLVYKVTSTHIYTIEGNTNASSGVIPNGGSVCLKSYTRATCRKNNTKFFHPDYSKVVGKKLDNGIKKSESTDKTETTAKPIQLEGKKYAIVNTKKDPLRCRKTATINGAILGTFDSKTQVEILEKTNKSFWKVKGKNSAEKTMTGYCSTSYLNEI